LFSTIPLKKRRIESLLDPLDIRIAGDRPNDITVNDERFYSAAASGILPAAEAYIAGWWDADRLDIIADRILTSGLPIRDEARLPLLLGNLQARLFNMQTRSRSQRVAREHYDLGNDLFRAMLDRRMIYSCAYWKDARTLDEAQEAKLDLVCRKAGLQPGMSVLDIGCGWGGLAQFAAERYGATVTGISVSAAQVELGRERCAGLPVEIRLMDYRDIRGQFDAIISIGMFEHVGFKNYRQFVDIVRRSLAPDGLFVLHTIGSHITRVRADAFMGKYIFPCGMIPSARQISEACEGRLLIEDWHNFGADYDKTLMAWFSNFDCHWPEVRARYGERFYRQWKCYLHFSAASFRSRTNQLWQIVLSPRGVRGGYRSVR
jgi:cyclopropane-fatty-acyl-phospholipid synthase